MINKGDPCYVRMKGGIIEVEYLGKCETIKKLHWIRFKSGRDFLVSRFVCMTGIKGKDNEHV